MRFGIDPRDLCLFLEVFMEDKTTSFRKRKIRQTNDLWFWVDVSFHNYNSWLKLLWFEESIEMEQLLFVSNVAEKSLVCLHTWTDPDYHSFIISAQVSLFRIFLRSHKHTKSAFSLKAHTHTNACGTCEVFTFQKNMVFVGHWLNH